MIYRFEDEQQQAWYIFAPNKDVAFAIFDARLGLSADEALDVLEKHFEWVDLVEGPSGYLILHGPDEVILEDADQVAELGIALLALAALKREQANA